MKHTSRVFIIITIIFLGMACSTGTKVTGSWTKPEQEPESFNKIVVLGIGHNSENRRIFEDHVETRLATRGYPVIAAHLDRPNLKTITLVQGDALGGGFECALSGNTLIAERGSKLGFPDIVVDIFRAANVDAVFTMSMRHMEDTRRYVSGQGYYMPYYYNVPFYDYYGSFNNYYYTPGYYTGSFQVFLEANLFDFSTGELLWSAQTKTVDVQDIEKMAEQFADVIVADFIGQNVVALPEKK